MNVVFKEIPEIFNQSNFLIDFYHKSFFIARKSYNLTNFNRTTMKIEI